MEIYSQDLEKHMEPSLSLALERSSSLLFRGQSLLQELLDLIDVCLHIPVECQEGRMGTRGEVVQVSRLSAERREQGSGGGLYQGTSWTWRPGVYRSLCIICKNKAGMGRRAEKGGEGSGRMWCDIGKPASGIQEQYRIDFEKSRA